MNLEWLLAAWPHSLRKAFGFPGGALKVEALPRERHSRKNF